MSDEYTWDRSGAPDEFVAQLERRLAPLAEEGDAMLDEVLGELEGEAVVVLLPSPPPPTPSRGWIWMSVAAALLLTISALMLVGDARRRISPSTIQVGGDAEPTARVRIGVGSLSSDVAGSERAALIELRTLHRPLAECAIERESSEPVAFELRMLLRAGEAPLAFATQSHRGELDLPTQTCVTRAVSEWQPSSLGAGEMSLMLEIEAGSRGNER